MEIGHFLWISFRMFKGEEEEGLLRGLFSETSFPVRLGVVSIHRPGQVSNPKNRLRNDLLLLLSAWAISMMCFGIEGELLLYMLQLRSTTSTR